MNVILLFLEILTGGHKEMSSILADQSALVYELKCGERESCGVSAMATAVHKEPK
jgi:hypothetical protein